MRVSLTEEWKKDQHWAVGYMLVSVSLTYHLAFMKLTLNCGTNGTNLPDMLSKRR